MSVLTFKSAEYATFPQFLKDYATHMSVIRGNSEKTICEYLLDVRTFFRYWILAKTGSEHTANFEECSISGLTVEDAAAVREEDILSFLMFTGIERENNTSTRMRKLSALRSFFHYAYAKKHLISHNPTADIEGPKRHVSLPKYLSFEETVRLLETVRSDTASPTVVRDYTMICLFVNTGMRLSELVGLNLDSFDAEITKVKVLGKGSKERVVYLNDMAVSAIKSYLRVRLDPKHVATGDKALFLSRLEKRISAKTVQWVVYKYLSLAGFGGRGLSVHKLRHTAATLMYQSGNVDIRVLKDILGHEQLNTTQIYTHVVDQNMKDAMKQNPLSGLKIAPPPHKTYDEEEEP